MTPEERLNQQVWEILQDIKEEILATVTGKPVKYRIPNIGGVGIISKDRRIKILYKLEEEKAFTIQRNSSGVRIGRSDVFYLIIDQLEFDKIYEKYQQHSDPNSNKNITELLAKQKSELAIRPSGYNPRSYMQTQKIQPSDIIDSFSPSNYQFVLTVLERIVSLSDFSSNNEISYKLQYPPGELIIQERMLLSKLEKLGLFRNLGEDGIFGIATLKNVDIKTIREVVNGMKQKQPPEEINEKETVFFDEKENKKENKNITTGKSNFDWESDVKFDLGNGKSITFGSSSSGRINIFKMLTDRIGEWVKVKDMAEKIGKSEHTVRVTIGQINDEHLKDTNIEIIERNDKSLPGAYKINVLQ